MAKDNSPSDSITKERILETMGQVYDPDLKRDLVSLGMVTETAILGRSISVNIELTTPACPLKDQIKKDAMEKLTLAFPEADKINVTMSSRVRNSSLSGEKPMPTGVKNIIAIGSGKGGVGKSTIALNIALSLVKTGAKVGLMDADIYGPSIAMMLGEKPSGGMKVEDELIVPLEKYGLKVVSFGLLLGEEKPVIWRGPMLGQAINQFLFQVKWQPLDYLVIDLPPGTGDVQLSIAQNVNVSGAVVVTTPQNVALLDAQKALAMFQQLQIPVLGVIENMSFFICPNCSHESHIFSTEGGSRLAKQTDVPLLGQIPIQTDIRHGGDAGYPAILMDEKSDKIDIFGQITEKLCQQLAIQTEMANQSK